MIARLWPSALLLAASCQTLPTQSIECATSGRCTPVSFVLGQPDAMTNTNLHFGLRQPLDVLIAGSSLVVAECLNNRVVIWKTLPTVSTQPPDLVLGQPDLNTNLANYGGVNASSMSCPGSVAFGTDKPTGRSHLAVGDQKNGRVLIWNGLPTSSFQPADVVVGQSEVTTGNATQRPSASTMTTPWVTISDDGKLIVSDQANNRVLIWNGIPQQDGQKADLVLGQMDANSDVTNYPTMMTNTAAGLDTPSGNPNSDGASVLASDTNNNRVLVWSPFPAADGPMASLALGQSAPNSINKMQQLSAKTLNGPAGVSRKNSQLLVADEQNSRVLFFAWPIVGVPPISATLVLGQADFASSLDNTKVLSASSLSRPRSSSSDGQHLAIADTDNNRILLYGLAGLQSGQAANLVLGQPDFSTNIANNVGKIGGNTLNAPFGLLGVGSSLIVSDQQNARLLFYSQLPQSSSDAPTAVWGQPDFAHGQHNTLGITDSNLCTPAGVATDGTRLFVTDNCNHRVLIFNTIPTSPAQKANLVLGQPDLMSGTSNNGGTSAHTLNAPQGVATDGQRLVVADTSNNRVLIWNSLPTKSTQDADLVLGQPSFTSGTSQTLDNTSLTGPLAVLISGNSLIVADSGADRVLIWNTFPTKTQAPADVVIGQAAFVNDLHLTPPDKGSLRTPVAVYQYQNRLYVTDRGNHRIMYWNALPTANGQSADGVIGQPSFFEYTANNSGDAAHPQLGAQSFNAPVGLFATADMLFVADQGNSRILVVPNPPLP